MRNEGAGGSAIEGRPVLIFGGSDWWLHNRATEHHWASELALEGHLVLYVNSIGVGLAPPTSAAVWRRIGRKLTSYARWLRRVDERLYVASPFTLPIWSIGWVRALNSRLLAWQVRLIMRLIGMRDPVVSSNLPTAHVVLHQLPGAAYLYFLMDNFSEYYEPMAFSQVREHDRAMRIESDIVVCASIGLYRELAAERSGVEWIPHGVNPLFLTPPSDEPPAGDISHISRPRIVYWGQLDSGVDLELLQQIAESRPEWQLVLIGPSNLDLSALAARANVYLPGYLPTGSLVAAAKHADVLIMPWKETPWTRYCCPVKFREYLATGRPIVSVPIIEVADAYDHVARIASGLDAWLEALEAAIADDDADQAARRRATVADYDIRASAARYRAALGRAVEIAAEREH